MIHPWAWAGWLAATLVALSATRNPLHLALMLLCIATVGTSVGSAEARYPSISATRFGVVVVPLAALFNAATSHFGDSVLFRLPKSWPVVGGAFTLEALAFGALNGLVLTGILAAFAVVNRALSVRDLLRLIPRAFYPVAVVISIGLTFVPVTLRQFQQIREAQAVRGHRLRGLRAWLPLFVPLLIGGLERALQLAEAMTARGFASSSAPRHDAFTQALTVLGLLALLSGWLLRMAWGLDAPGLALMLAGAAVIFAVLWLVGRRVPRTNFRPAPWTGRDWLVVLSAGALAVALVLPVGERGALQYYPYPRLTWPDFAPLVGVLTVGLLGPAAVAGTRKKEVG